MKIQETINGPEPSDGYEEIPQLDLSTLMEDSNWGGQSLCFSICLFPSPFFPSSASLAPAAHGWQLQRYFAVFERSDYIACSNSRF